MKPKLIDFFLVALLFCLHTKSSCCSGDLFSEQEWQNCQIIDPDTEFKIQWNIINGTYLLMEMSCLTPGWLAIGLSMDGTMDSNGKGTDIVLGFFKDNQGYVGDYWTKETNLPTYDHQQDVTFIRGSQENGTTTIVFARLLQTNDTYDRILYPPETSFLIWAHHPMDPTNIPGTLFSMHSHFGSLPFQFSDFSTCPTEDQPSLDSVEINWKNSDGTFSLGWKIDNKNEKIVFRADASTSGWVGLGFSLVPSMLYSDMVVGLYPSTLMDLCSNDKFATPIEDVFLGGTDDVKMISMEYFNNKMKLLFERKLTTEDNWDMDLKDMQIYLLWAYGEDNDFSRKHIQRGIVSVNLYFTNSTKEVPVENRVLRSFKFSIHASIQLSSWLMMMTNGLYVAHFMRHIHSWVYVHILHLLLSVVLFLLAISLLCFSLSVTITPHSIFGFVLVAVIVVQSILGMIALKKYNPEKSPSVFTVVHTWLGKIAWVLGLGNVFFGMIRYQLYRTDDSVYGVVVLSLFCVWCLIVATVGGIYFYKRYALKSGRRLVNENTQVDNRLMVFDESTIDLGHESVNEIHEPEFRFKLKRKLLANKHHIILLSLNVVVVFIMIGFILAIPDSTAWAPFKYCPDCVIKQWTNIDFQVPVGLHHNKVPDSTSYTCTGFKFDMDRQYHIVQFTPIIKSELVHHMILYTIPWDATNKAPFDCLDMPDSSFPLFMWGTGGEPLQLPFTAGIKVGKDTAAEYVVLQMHYNNPALLTDVFDSSGVEIKMTPHLRKNDIGYLILGSNFQIELPPRMPLYEISGNCSHEWTESLPFPIHIFSTAIHAHLLGKAIWTEIFRDGLLFDWFGEPALVYNFNKQEQQQIEEIRIMPGDDLITHCIYDTTSRANTTYGGWASEDEMCLNIVLYYPKLDATTCLSKPMVVDMNATTYSRPRSRLYLNL